MLTWFPSCLVQAWSIIIDVKKADDLEEVNANMVPQLLGGRPGRLQLKFAYRSSCEGSMEGSPGVKATLVTGR